ncbi:MAG TPA: hypothetical protein VEL81_00595 [Thermoplasmata archaeon]|nr:hypothetical protein [Thermoplasmata archaeon]
MAFPLDRVEAAGILLALGFSIIMMASSTWFWPPGGILAYLILVLGLLSLKRVRRAQRARWPGQPA